MMKSQEIQLDISEKRAAFSDLVATRLADDAPEADVESHRAAVETARTEINTLEGQWRAAVEAEEAAGASETRVGAGDMPTIAPELREALDVESRASLGVFVRAALEEIPVDGAEAEYRGAIFESDGDRHPLMPSPIPWALFLQPDELRAIREAQVEKRAVITSPASFPAMQDPIIQAVFAASTAAFLNTRFSAAGPGQNVEYVLTSSGASGVAASGMHTAAGSLTAVVLQPRRITTKYELQAEQIASVRGLESAVRADIPRTIMNQIDNMVLNGGAAPNFPRGILNSLTEVDMTAEATFSTGIAAFAAAIDGQYARSLKEVKIVVSPVTMRHMYGLLASNTAVTLNDYFMMNSGGIMCTANMPATASMINDSIACKSGPGMMGNIAAKMWGGGVQIKRDDSSGAVAEKGEVHITGLTLADYAVLRTAGFAGIGYHSG